MLDKLSRSIAMSKFDESLIFDITKILLPKCLILIYCLIAKVMHYRMLFIELKSSH